MKKVNKSDKWIFTFTISDLSKFLGKAPVTLRGWDKQKLIDIPKEKSGNRKLTTSDMHKISENLYKKNKIPRDRRNMIKSIMTMLELIEKENNK